MGYNPLALWASDAAYTEGGPTKIPLTAGGLAQGFKPALANVAAQEANEYIYRLAEAHNTLGSYYDGLFTILGQGSGDIIGISPIDATYAAPWNKASGISYLLAYGTDADEMLFGYPELGGTILGVEVRVAGSATLPPDGWNFGIEVIRNEINIAYIANINTTSLGSTTEPPSVDLSAFQTTRLFAYTLPVPEVCDPAYRYTVKLSGGYSQWAIEELSFFAPRLVLSGA